MQWSSLDQDSINTTVYNKLMAKVILSCKPYMENRYVLYLLTSKLKGLTNDMNVECSYGDWRYFLVVDRSTEEIDRLEWHEKHFDIPL